MKNKLNLAKIGDSKMGVSSKQGPPKFKLLHLLIWTHKAFKLSKYIRKIKLDQIWGYQNGRSPQTRPPKFKNLLTIHVKHMKFSGWTIMKAR